ncbi:MAG: hypothetical protein II782_02120 [Oscillospiraceae bacterium]|nr:hypothetical protein [Oscillospiraceae bacterium]
MPLLLYFIFTGLSRRAEPFVTIDRNDEISGIAVYLNEKQADINSVITQL